MKQLVGWFRKSLEGDPRLRMEETYNVAYDGLMGALRNCLPVECWGGDEPRKPNATGVV